jgi:orotate phosphoribosyltransferase
MAEQKREGVDELARILLKTGCLRFGTFKLSSGILSPYYIDLRLIPSDPEAFKKIIRFYSDVLQGTLLERSTRIAGIPITGIAYGAVLSFNFKKPFLYVRKEAKEYGGRRKIEGLLFPGERVLVLDDILTSGSNLLNAVQAIRAEGGIVEDAVVLLDRQQGGAENLKKTGVNIHPYATISQVCSMLLSKGEIEESDYDQIIEQIQQATETSSI